MQSLNCAIFFIYSKINKLHNVESAGSTPSGTLCLAFFTIFLCRGTLEGGIRVLLAEEYRLQELVRP